MPILHDKEKLNQLLMEHGIPINDAVKRGKFYKEFFDWDLYCKMYKDGSSIRDICRITNLSYDVVRANLKENLGDLRPFTVKGNSKYTFNTELFFPVVKNVGAYFLGWMYSDGSITHNRISIVLKKTDYKHLEYLAGLVSDKKVVTKETTKFDYFSVDLCDSLISKYNLLPNKSHLNFKIPFELFTSETLPYLLLGLIEGDGSISNKYPNCSLLITSNTWIDLEKLLKHNGVTLTKTKIHNINGYGLVNIVFSGESYFSLLKYIYSNTTEVIPLQRKFNRFLNQLDRSSKGVTSPYKKLAVNIRDSLNYTL